MADQSYLSTDPNAGQPVSLGGYLSTDPNAGISVPTDSRSAFARAVDALSQPTAPGRWLARHASALADAIDAPALTRSPTVAAIRGGVAGMVQGAGDTLAGYSSPLGVAAVASGFGAERAGAAGLITAARTLRGVEAATGGAFAARGVEQAVDAPDLSGKALGIAQAASGALGVRGGVQGLRLRGDFLSGQPAPARPIVGTLRAAPGFVADAAGRVAPFGTDIPMEQAPDGSYVRSVPAEYARREVRGLLESPRGFVVDGQGTAVPTVDASYLSTDPQAGRPVAAGGPDASSVRSVAAAPVAYEYQGRSLVPTQFSSDPNAAPAPTLSLTDAEAHELRRMGAEMDALPFTKHTFNDTRGRGGDVEITPGAAGAPVYQDIIGDVSGASRGDVQIAIANLLAGKRTPTGDLALDVARRRMAGDRSLSRPLLPPEAGDLPTTADRLDTGEWQTRLPEAGEVRDADRPMPGFDAPFTLSGGVSQMHQPAPRSLSFEESNPLDAFVGDQPHDAPLGGEREPGEEGRLSPMLAARLGLGSAGAAYGAATGTDTEDRVKRALLFGGAGALAPSLLEAGGGAAAAVTRSGESVTTDPTPVFTQKPEAMPDIAIPSARPMADEQKLGASWLGRYSPELRAPLARTFQEYDGFEGQRRFVQPDARVEALAQRIAVDLGPQRAGSIANVEESRAMANATATLFDRVKAVRAQMATGTTDPAVLTAQLGKLYQDGAVMLGNVRANASEQGRALRGQQIINAALQSYDTRILQEASKRLGPQLKLFAEQLAQLPDDPQAFYNLLKEHVQAGRGPTDQFFSYLYNNVLSGPATFLKNVLGTSTNLAFQTAANAVAGALEARKPIDQRSVLLGESSASLPAMASGLFKGGKAALFILQHGYDPLAVERGEIPGIFTETPGGALTNWPTRLTRAVHGVLLGEGARSAEATGLAYTQAAKDAAARHLSGPALEDFLAQQTAALSVDPDIQAQASHAAARATFTEEPGPTLRAFGNLLNSNRALKFMQMFWKVTGNIAVQQMRDNTPLAFVPALGDSGVYAGGRVGAQAQGRALLGTAILAPLVAAIGAGAVTGEGPTDPKRRPLWLATHQPNAIRIGDHWIDYRALPIATPLSLLANVFEAYHEGRASDADTSQVLSALASRAGNVITSQPFLSGITAFVNAMEKPAEQGSQFLKSTAQALVPASGLLRNVTRAVDPTYREVHTPLDAVKEIIPGQSSTLPPRLDVFGAPLQRPGGPIARMLAPSVPVASTTDPLVNRLESMQAPIGADHRETTLKLAPGLSVAVPPAADLQRRAAAGQTLRPVLEQLTSSPRFQALPADSQREIVSQVTSTIRGSVRAQADALIKAHAAADHQLLRGAVMDRLNATQGAR